MFFGYLSAQKRKRKRVVTHLDPVCVVVPRLHCLFGLPSFACKTLCLESFAIGIVVPLYYVQFVPQV